MRSCPHVCASDAAGNVAMKGPHRARGRQLAAPAQAQFAIRRWKVSSWEADMSEMIDDDPADMRQ